MNNEIRQIIVTGASSHLGKALIAIGLARGHRIIAVSRRPADLGDMPEDKQLVVLSGMDLMDTVALERLRKVIHSQFSLRFGVVNCTGYFPGHLQIGDLPVTEARKVMESNFLTFYGVAHSLLPLMLERGGGDFVTFSAHSQYQSYPMMGAFNSSKAAIEALTITLSNEYLHAGIRANCFALATMLTPEEQMMKPKGDHTKWLAPNEVAQRVIEFLERADPIISGNIIQMYKYSDSYFGQSYFSRIEK